MENQNFNQKIKKIFILEEMTFFLNGDTLHDLFTIVSYLDKLNHQCIIESKSDSEQNYYYTVVLGEGEDKSKFEIWGSLDFVQFAGDLYEGYLPIKAPEALELIKHTI